MGERARYDKYGRPLPHLAPLPPEDLTERTSNAQQRARIEHRVRMVLAEHYPHLLRRDVSAEVRITFTVVRGMIQEDLFVDIRRQYRGEED